MSDRLAGAFSNPASIPSDGRPDGQAEHRVDFDGTLYEDPVLALFPIARQGYDCAAVDEHLAELEAALAETGCELEELRGQRSSRADVAAEIERLGEQTSAILITAHDKASETVSLAEAQAQISIADAASYAAALREEVELERRRAEAELKSLRRERARLIDDIQSTATALSSLAADAAAR